MAQPVPFQTNPRYTQIAMAVKPEGMIADEVCPRIQVESEKFIYTKLDHEELFTIPDTKIGRKSAANEVEFGGTDVTDSVNDFALDDFVPQRDIEVAAGAGTPYDPQATAVEGVSILLDLAREKRVADLIFTLNNYDASLRDTLSGTSQWSHADSDPVAAITAMLDEMLVRPNLAVFGRKTWTKLRSHPKVVAAALNKGMSIAGGEAAKGILSSQQVADLFELEKILIGESFVNTAKKGQTAAYAGLWGKHASFLRIDRNVRSVRGMAMPTFAFTAQFGTRFSGTIQDQKRGIKGGTTVRVGEQVKELIAFSIAGCHFHDAVA